MTRSNKIFLPCAIFAQLATLGRGAEFIDGIVMTGNRTPCADATVSLVEDRPAYLVPQSVQSLVRSKTDTTGRFRLAAPDSTVSLALLASAPGFRLARFALSDPDRPSGGPVGIVLEPGSSLTGKVIDAAGKPLAGAALGPVVAGLDAREDVRTRVVPQWTRSGADGAFRFDNLPGDTDLRFLARAHGKMTADVAFRSAAAGVAGTSKTMRVELKPGGTAVAVRPGGRLTPAGPTWAGAVIRVNGNGFDDCATAGPDGVARFAGLPPGSYSAEVIVDEPRFCRAAVVTLPKDKGMTFDVAVAEGFNLSGTAIDAATSAPAAGVVLKIADQWTTTGADGGFSAGPLFVQGAMPVEVGTAGGWRAADAAAGTPLPDADGVNDMAGLILRVKRGLRVTAEISGLELTTGTVTLHVLSADGRRRSATVTTTPAVMTVESRDDAAMAYAESGATATELAPVEFGPDGGRMRLRLDEAAGLPGKVTRTGPGAVAAETTAGTAAGAVTKGFRVSMYGEPTLAPRALVAEAACARDGSFRFPALPSGRYKIEAANASRTKVRALDIELKPGANTPVEILFRLGARLGGRVVRPDGQPAPGATLRAFLRDGAAGRGEALSLEADADGRFSADDLEADLIEVLTAEQAGAGKARMTNIALPAPELKVTLGPEPGVRVTVAADPSTAWHVTVMALAAAGGGAYPDQTTGHEAGSGDTVGGTPLDIPLSTAGRYVASARPASRPEPVAAGAPFDWKPDAAEPVEVTLDPAATGRISGTAAGAPDGIDVMATNTTVPNEPAGDKRATVQGAAFEFPSLAPGVYLLAAAGAGYAAEAVNIEVKPGQTTQVTLTAPTRATLRGTVENGGRPVAGATVTLLTETDQGAKPMSAVTGADGGFEFADLAAASYAVTATAPAPGGAGAAGAGSPGAAAPATASRSVTVSRDRAPAPVRLDLTPPPAVAFTPPPAWKLSPAQPVTLMNLETKVSVAAKWTTDGRLEAPLAAGDHEVREADRTAGVVTVSEAGKVAAKTP